MRYAELESIWEKDLSALSGRAKGRVYSERASEVLVPRSLDPSLYGDWGALNLGRAAELIGCGLSALYQNTVIRGIIADLEAEDRAGKPREPLESEICRQAKNVVDFPVQRTRRPSRYEVGKIVVADVILPYKGGVERLFSIPTLIWKGTIDCEVSDYMRALALAGKTPATLLQYAKILREFRRFCRAKEIAWDEVTDDVLLAYRVLKQNKGIQTRHVNAVIGAVFQFYLWCEQTGRLRDHVQLYNLPDYPPAMHDHPFAIKSDEYTTKDGKKLRVSKIKVGDSARHPNRPTPTKLDIESVHAAEVGSRHEERNSLLYSWAEITGARSFEVLQITMGQLPTREQLDRVFAGTLEWSVTVYRKGGRVGKLYPTPDLLRRTLDFGDNEREDVVEKCTQAGRTVSGRLFIGDRGTALTTSGLCGLARRAFGKARVRGSYHRLRAVRAQREVERAFDAVGLGDIEVGPDTLWKHAILMRAADILDHRSLRSLEHYLNNYINSRIQRSAASKLHFVEAAIAEKQRTIAAIERRIERERERQALDPVLAEFLRTGTLKNASRDNVVRLQDVRAQIERFEASWEAAA
jgi:hypothetical protein